MTSDEMKFFLEREFHEVKDSVERMEAPDRWREHYPRIEGGDRLDQGREPQRARDVGQRAGGRCAKGPAEDGTQPVAIRHQVWLLTGHAKELGTGQVASRRAHARAAGCHCEASGSGRGRTAESQLIC